MDSFYKGVGKVVTTIFVVFVFALIGAAPTYFLWNWLSPTVFHGPSVTLFQAWGLTFLCSMLFKSSGSSKS